jgi:hypothetical protein
MGYVGSILEEIPSLVAVACLLPGRAKDLSAPPRNGTYKTELNADYCGHESL